MEIILGFSYFLLGYLIGFISSWIIKDNFFKTKDLNVASTVALVVLGIWAFSMIIDILSSDYETSPLVQGLMGAIVGFFYKTNKKK